MEALETAAASGPDSRFERFSAALGSEEADRRGGRPGAIAWSRIVSALPAAAGWEARVGAVGVLVDLDDVETTGVSTADGETLIVASFSGADGSERLVLSAATGLPIRYERLRADGTLDSAVSYGIQRATREEVFG